MKRLHALWSDETGFIVSAELVLVATAVVIGMTVGLTVLRNQVVQELVDVGQAIGSLNQSYAFAGVAKPGVAFTGGSFYIDKVDFCQDVYQAPGTEPGGISVRVWPRGAPLVPSGGELFYSEPDPWACEELCGEPHLPLSEEPFLESPPWHEYRTWPEPIPWGDERPRLAPPEAKRRRLAPPDSLAPSWEPMAPRNEGTGREPTHAPEFAPEE